MRSGRLPAGAWKKRPASSRYERPFGPYLGVGQAGSAQGRIDVPRIGLDAIAHPARFVVEEVGRDDLEIVVGGVGEGAFAVAVAQGPDPRLARSF